MKQWKENVDTGGGKIIEMPPSQTKIRKINRSTWAAAATLFIILSVGFLQYNKNKEFTEKMLLEHVDLDSKTTRATTAPPSRIDIEKIMQGLGEKPNRESIEKAISALSMGNTLDSNYEQAQVQIGRLYTHLGNWTMAEKAYLNGHARKSLMETSQILALMKSKEIGSKELQNKLDTMLQDSDDENDDILKEIQHKTQSIWWRLFN
jgi:hypothetical protein